MSIIDERHDDVAGQASFSAPELPLMWWADDSVAEYGMVVIAHRLAIADGTFPVTGVVQLSQAVTIAELEALELTVERVHRDDDGTTALLRSEGVSISAFLGSGRASLRLAVAEVSALDAWEQILRAAFPGTPEPGVTQIRSWAMGERGPQARHVRHEFAEWVDSRGNFPASTRDMLDRLVALERPSGGSMMVWHGAPGTGKTTAIRSLARAWTDWCDVELVVDPEALFGSAAYLMNVLSAGPLWSPWDDGGGDADERPKRWKLVVVEDCDDLLLRAAQSGSNGQLSRLLNVSDGLLGQEMNVIVLFTTNAPLSAVHPAVLRPGRCLATVEFHPFSASEVASRDSDVTAQEMTLAELMTAEGDLPAVVGSSEEAVRGYL